MQRRPRMIEPLGAAEHQRVHAGMRPRIGDIGPGLCQGFLQPRWIAGAGRRHRSVELPEAYRGEFAEKAGEIAEVMGRRGMRHPGLARHRAQGEALQAVALQQLFGGLKQRLMQRAVMIPCLLDRCALRSGSPGRAGFRSLAVCRMTSAVPRVLLLTLVNVSLYTL